MNRSLVLLAALMPVFLVYTDHGAGKGSPMRTSYANHRERAVQINDLAGRIHSPSESHQLVDLIAETFANELPPAWVTGTIRDRVAQAEFQSVTDPAKRIPEQRIVDAWNTYMEKIGAPRETLVTVAEIHNLREGQAAAARFLWSRGSQSIWTMPNVYAAGPNGPGEGSRAVEALRVVWDLANQFDNLQSARERVQKGVYASKMIEQSMQENKADSIHSQVRIQAGMRENPVESAERRYVREHSAADLTEAIEALIYTLIPPQT